MKVSKDDMQAEYDFSNGVRGKYYVPRSEIKIPHYLDSKTEEELWIQAERFGKSPDEFLQILIEKELEILKRLA